MPLPELFKACSSVSEVKRRYRELAEILHPDKNSEAPEAATRAMQQLNQEKAEAIELLKRESYNGHVTSFNESESRKQYGKWVKGYAWDDLEMSLAERHSARLWIQLWFERRNPTQEDFETYLTYIRVWTASADQKPEPQKQAWEIAHEEIAKQLIEAGWEEF